MKKIIYVLLAAAVCCGVFSCNEKPKHYRIVKVTASGEQEEQLDAKNDTDALNQYISRMEAELIQSVIKGEEPSYKEMFVISPDGDTLNTNKELLEAVSKGLPTMKEPLNAVTDSAAH